MNLTGYSSIIGAVIMIKAQKIHLHNSDINADGLGFYGGDPGDNVAVTDTHNGRVNDQATGTDVGRTLLYL